MQLQGAMHPGAPAGPAWGPVAARAAGRAQLAPRCACMRTEERARTTDLSDLRPGNNPFTPVGPPWVAGLAHMKYTRMFGHQIRFSMPS